MTGVRHLVQCRCVLPQFRDLPAPVFHKFTAFSVIDDTDAVESKLTRCDNCGAVHRVTDIFRSTILTGNEDASSIMTIDDIRASLPQRIGDILSSYSAHISSWEEVQFIMQMQTWGAEIILTKEDIDGNVQGKKLRILGHDNVVIVPFSSALTFRSTT